ncbi:MAG: hypothetical protein J6T10_29840 [Methanobrevibacter sp.]|nr:hypothetical protein [Methanobrevibacter sp.]
MKILNFEVSFTDKVTSSIFSVERFQKSLNCKRIKQKVFYDKDLNLYDTGMYSVMRTLEPNTDISNKRVMIKLLFSLNYVPSIIYWLNKVIKEGWDQDLVFKDGACRFHWYMEKTDYKDTFGNPVYYLDAKMNSTRSQLYLNEKTITQLVLKMHVAYSDHMQSFLLRS